ncbi:MAG: Bug family tripartite tricarboxylate transporter substrate binding protein [Burkholderiales bacterium]
MFFRIVLGIVALASISSISSITTAQPFPSRPVTVVIPFPPGGISDNSTRIIGQKFTENTGQPLVVENRPGAGGQIGADAVRKARPDGYTLFLANIGSHGINQSLYSKLSYDPIKDFEPVTSLFISPTLVLVPSASPVKSMTELIDYAKARPGKVTYGSQSIGSGGHLSGEIVKAKHGLDLTHVPYKGSAPVLADLVAGRIDFLFDPITTALPFVKDGRLRALGVTADKRSPLAPDVPTLDELGFKGYDVNPWFGLAAPAGTPRPIIDRLHAEFVKALKDPAVVKRLADQGIDTVGNTPAEFAKFIETETTRWTAVVKTSGAKAD